MNVDTDDHSLLNFSSMESVETITNGLYQEVLEI